MAFPGSFLEELKARVGLAEVVGRRVKLIRRGREHIGLCPFHNEKTPSFSVVEDKGFYYCFGCGAKGSAIDFVMNTEGLSFPEAVERLALEAGMEVPRSTPEEQAKEQQRRTLYDVVEAAALWYEKQLAGNDGAAAREYLLERGITHETTQRFRLGLAPDRRDGLKTALLARGIPEVQLREAGMLIAPEDGGDSYDRFRQRLMFPITDRRGRVVAFGGRALGEQKAKYLNSPETPLFHKGAMLYNLANAREAARRDASLVVVEGYMDVIALDQAGIRNAVAPLGTALTEGQLAEMWKLAPEPILCFDGDAAGDRAAQRAAERALPVLAPGHSLRFIELPADEDPDTLVRSQGSAVFIRLMEGARPLADVLWDSQLKRRDVTTPERRAGFRDDLRQLVRKISDSTVRGYYGEHFKVRLDEAFSAGGRPAPANKVGRGRGGRPPALGGRLSRRHGLGQGGFLRRNLTTSGRQS
jgi:DNA primase